MSKEILRLMVSGNMDLGGMARELDVTIDVLKSRIDMMIHMRYIEEILVDGESCGECIMKKGCGEEKEGCITAYRLTEKGKKVIGK